MKEIGGFFELELRRGREFHEEAFALNSARNCLRLIVRTKGIKQLLVPLYTCNAVIHALMAEGVEIIPYSIEADFSPILASLKDDYLLYINYFGVNSENIRKLSKNHSKLIVDNAQAFYSQPIANIDTFYSPRKFFGVPDGGYIYFPQKYMEDEIETAVSYDRFEHLLKRIDLTASGAYPDFRRNEETISAAPIRKMSHLTRALLGSINYEEARTRRLENFYYLHHAIGAHNDLPLRLGPDDVPMVYPYLTKNPALRQKLIKHSIYVATYWPDSAERIPAGTREAYLVSNLVPLPIDQRYGKEELDVMIALVMDNLPE
jgi:hypothetical protein